MPRDILSAVLQRYARRGPVRRYQSHEAFKSAIHDNPGDFGPHQVYADHLEEQGDPRGESLRWHATGLQDLMRQAASGTHEPPGELHNYLDRIQALPHGEQLNRVLATQFIRHTPVGGGRTTWDLLTHPDSRRAVEVAELHAHGLTSEEERERVRTAAHKVAFRSSALAAWAAANSAVWSASGPGTWTDTQSASRPAADSVAHSAARSAAWATGEPEANVAAQSAARSAQKRMAEALLNTKKPTGLKRLARRYAKYKAPPGGMVVRGLSYAGGRFLPEEAVLAPRVARFQQGGGPDVLPLVRWISQYARANGNGDEALVYEILAVSEQGGWAFFLARTGDPQRPFAIAAHKEHPDESRARAGGSDTFWRALTAEQEGRLDGLFSRGVGRQYKRRGAVRRYQQHEAMLRAIAEEGRTSEGPHLVYADWLGERGDPLERVIRQGVEPEHLRQLYGGNLRSVVWRPPSSYAFNLRRFPEAGEQIWLIGNRNEGSKNVIVHLGLGGGLVAAYHADLPDSDYRHLFRDWPPNRRLFYHTPTPFGRYLELRPPRRTPRSA